MGTDDIEQKILRMLVRRHTLPVARLAMMAGVPLGTLMKLLHQFERQGLVQWREADSKTGGIVTATSEARSTAEAG